MPFQIMSLSPDMNKLITDMIKAQDWMYKIRHFSYYTSLFVDIKMWYFQSICRFGRIELVKWCVENRSPNISWGFIGACKGGNVEIVRYLIDTNARLEWQHGFDSAAQEGCLNVLKFLVEFRRWNYRPLNLFRKIFKTKMHKNYWKVKPFSYCWNNAMIYATVRNHKDVVEYLLEKGACNIDECLAIACGKEYLSLAIILSKRRVFCVYCDKFHKS